MNNKPIRYIVINPGQTDFGYSASYNTSPGPDRWGCDLALFYARQNAGRFGGEIFAQYAENDAYQPLRAPKKSA